MSRNLPRIALLALAVVLAGTTVGSLIGAATAVAGVAPALVSRAAGNSPRRIMCKTP